MEAKKVKVRAVRREPPSMEDAIEFARNFETMVRKGDFDAVLDVLWNATDGRLRAYFDEDGGPDGLQESRAEKIRMMRTAPENLTAGHYYGVHGAKYESVIVKYIGDAVETDDNGIPKVKVQIVASATGLVPGKNYKLPSGALTILPESQSSLQYRYGGSSR